VGSRDSLAGEASRTDVAGACVESSFYPSSNGQVFELLMDRFLN
jgi:hypothetical protein